MIHLEKGQKLFDNQGMVVYDQTGYYNDGDSVICAMVYSPDEPSCRFEAKFIAFGNIVYSISDPEKLLEEVKKINPETLFGKNKEEIAVDKMVENIKVAESEDLSVSENIPEEEAVLGENTENQAMIEEEVVQEVVVPEEIIPEPSATNTSSTTPATVEVTDIVTEPVVEPVVEPVIEPVSEPVIDQVIPVIDNVINDLNKISDVIESVTDTSTSTNITP